jgi:hypothetical protein
MESKQATIKIEKRSDYISARIAGDLEYGIIEDVKKYFKVKSLKQSMVIF